MTSPDNQFRVVLRGYDPVQVDQALSDLGARLANAERATQELTERVRTEQQHLAEQPAPEPAGFGHLGERITQILQLAEQEAAEVRDSAQAEAEATRKDAEQGAVLVRDEADHYAEQRRRDADTEAARIVTDAKRTADENLDAAERDASARRQEAEAVYEQQRANAAAAAADFETTLAERRERAATEFSEQMAVGQQQMDAMTARVEEIQAQAEREQSEADKEARRIVTEAQEQASAIVRDAKVVAERVRSESERELSAATQRRDSINAQLVNVRQMLATLSGSASGFAVDPLPDHADEIPVDPVDENVDADELREDEAGDELVEAVEADAEDASPETEGEETPTGKR